MLSRDLLRHSSPMMTLGVYAKAVTADKRAAQDTIVSLITGRKKHCRPKKQKQLGPGLDPNTGSNEVKLLE